MKFSSGREKPDKKRFVDNTTTKMKQYKIFVIFLYVISVCDIRVNSQTSVISNVHHLQRMREPLRIKNGKRLFPATNQTGDIFELFFGVLLPEEPIDMDIGCTYKEALPAIELAIKKLQEPGGLFEQFSICVEYRDTKSSSVDGSFAAFDLYTKKQQGYFFFKFLCGFFVIHAPNKYFEF